MKLAFFLDFSLNALTGFDKLSWDRHAPHLDTHTHTHTLLVVSSGFQRNCFVYPTYHQAKAAISDGFEEGKEKKKGVTSNTDADIMVLVELISAQTTLQPEGSLLLPLLSLSNRSLCSRLRSRSWSRTSKKRGRSN